MDAGRLSLTRLVLDGVDARPGAADAGAGDHPRAAGPGDDRVGVIMLAHAWAIPELYANRGAKVVKPKPRAGEDAERTALGLLGDLVDHRARELHARTGLVMERGTLGVWLVGEAGALLVRGVACTAGACGTDPTSRPAIASRICCWRCAPMRRASPRSPTMRSRARAGACGGGCPSGCARRWTRFDTTG